MCKYCFPLHTYVLGAPFRTSIPSTFASGVGCSRYPLFGLRILLSLSAALPYAYRIAAAALLRRMSALLTILQVLYTGMAGDC
jgi:uncharacterized protein (DUF2062 family)